MLMQNVTIWWMQAVSLQELHGVLDAETRDWTDGLLPCIFRDLNKPLTPGKARPDH